MLFLFTILQFFSVSTDVTVFQLPKQQAEVHFFFSYPMIDMTGKTLKNDIKVSFQNKEILFLKGDAYTSTTVSNLFFDKKVFTLDQNKNYKVELITYIDEKQFNSTSIVLNTSRQLYSDIMLADKLEHEERLSVKNPSFTKNGLFILPLRAKNVNTNVSNYLAYYFEDYKNKDTEVVATIEILQNDKSILLNNISYVSDSFGGLIAGKINIGKLASGRYQFLFTNSDTTFSKQFYISGKKKKEYVQEQLSLSLTDSLIFSSLYILADNNIRNQLSQFDSNAKYRFIQNQFIDKKEKDSFLKLIHFVNKKYSSAKQKGIKSDAGYVLLKYGMPINVYQKNSSTETNNLEVWTYNNSSEGQIKFLFSDINNTGKYRLITSTSHREMRDRRWKEKVFKSAFTRDGTTQIGAQNTLDGDLLEELSEF